MLARPLRLVAVALFLLLPSAAQIGGEPRERPGFAPSDPPTRPELETDEQPVQRPPLSEADEPEEPAVRFPAAREFYPPRPQVTTVSAELTALLDEIEAEAARELPLFGQAIFRQQAIDRYTQSLLPQHSIAEPPPSYRVQPGDRFSVTYWNDLVDPVTVEAQVQSDGRIGFGPVDPVAVSGLSYGELKELLTREVQRRGPRAARVLVSLAGLHSIRVKVTGEVRRGNSTLTLSGFATLMDALAAAGGPRASASLRTVRLVRGGVDRTIDLYPSLLEGEPGVDEVLRDGDSIHVFVARRLVAVGGGVVRQARYELVDEQSVAEALALAGGVLPRATGLQVVRVEDYVQEVLIDIPVGAVMAGDERLATVEPLRHGDQIEVQLLGSPNRQLVIEGAVNRRGTYGWREGITLGELVALAQGVSGVGYAPTGQINRLQPDGGREAISFVIADLIAGGDAANVPLQPGDVVTITRLLDRPPITVAVFGAVNYPDTYQTAGRFTVNELILRAGGLAPGAALTGAVLTSMASGRPEDIRIDLSAVPGGGQPEPNPLLQNGDQLRVAFVHELGGAPLVRIDGLVRQPASFPLSTGMRVADLLELAGGTLPRARSRARLQRLVPGSGQTERLTVDLGAAMQGDPAHNLLLAADDLLEVASADLIGTPGEPIVSITGMVNQPGWKPLYEGMTVADLLDDARGVQTGADLHHAYLRRIDDDGRVRSIAVNLLRASDLDPEHNLVLQPGDVLEILPAQAVVNTPQVRVDGAVYRPGAMDLTIGMTIEELMVRAGGATPEAYRERASLWRRTPNGQGVVLWINLDGPLNLPLEDGDQLTVLRLDEAVHLEATVEIRGTVQNPGQYPRTEGMTLRDLIWMAGGPTLGIGMMTCELARARGLSADVIPVDLRAVMAGDETANLVLQDGDSAYLNTLGAYLHAPEHVLIRGAVHTQGQFALRGDGESLREMLLERVGGVTENAFAEGAMLLRRVEEVIPPEQALFASEVWEYFVQRNERDNIGYVLARQGNARVEQLPQVRRDLPIGAVRSPLAELLSQRRDLTQIEEDIEELLQRMETPTETVGETTEPGNIRRVERFLPEYIRIQIDLAAILAGETDLELRPNDVLLVHRVPEMITVMGEVAVSQGYPYAEGRTLRDYVRLAGDFTNDADVRETRVLHADGTVDVYRPNDRIRRGDLILVPPRMINLPRETDPLRTIQAVAQVVGALATTIIAIGNTF